MQPTLTGYALIVIAALLLVAIILLAVITYLLYFFYRKNSIDGLPPEVTLKQQLEDCWQSFDAQSLELNSAKQDVDVFKTLAQKRSEVIDELTQALDNEKD